MLIACSCLHLSELHMTSPFSCDLALNDLNEMHCNFADLLLFMVDKCSVHKNVTALTCNVSSLEYLL